MSGPVLENEDTAIAKTSPSVSVAVTEMKAAGQGTRAECHQVSGSSHRLEAVGSRILPLSLTMKRADASLEGLSDFRLASQAPKSMITFRLVLLL